MDRAVRTPFQLLADRKGGEGRNIESGRRGWGDRRAALLWGRRCAKGTGRAGQCRAGQCRARHEAAASWALQFNQAEEEEGGQLAGDPGTHAPHHHHAPGDAWAARGTTRVVTTQRQAHGGNGKTGRSSSAQGGCKRSPLLTLLQAGLSAAAAAATACRPRMPALPNPSQPLRRRCGAGQTDKGGAGGLSCCVSNQTVSDTVWRTGP